MELIIPNQEVINTKDRITIDVIKDGENFLKQFDINHELLLDVTSIIYRYLRITGKIPHNLYKFFISAYYIISRHPMAFPVHEPKKKFCKIFGLQPSSLDYCVEKLTGVLRYEKILDDKNFPYYFDPKNDLSFKLAKNMVKMDVEKSMMNFLIGNQQFNAQFLTEELVTKLIFEMNAFPEELFRQFYEILYELVESALQEQNYSEYVQLQNKYFI